MMEVLHLLDKTLLALVLELVQHLYWGGGGEGKGSVSEYIMVYHVGIDSDRV